MVAGPDISYAVRSFQPADQPFCKKLYAEGLIGGKLADNDTGTDIDDIQSAYMRSPGNHFWVAELARPAESDARAPATSGPWPAACPQVVGMIGVQHHERGVGEVRRLRVHQHFRRRGIGSALMEAALKFCQERQYLKVMLDTFMEREPAIKLFEKFRFRHSRTRDVGGKTLLYFYLDLYMGEERKQET